MLDLIQDLQNNMVRSIFCLICNYIQYFSRYFHVTFHYMSTYVNAYLGGAGCIAPRIINGGLGVAALHRRTNQFSDRLGSLVRLRQCHIMFGFTFFLFFQLFCFSNSSLAFFHFQVFIIDYVNSQFTFIKCDIFNIILQNVF